MPGKLLQELRRQVPFGSVHEELVLNVLRTADHFRRGFEELLKPYNLSSTQYNVLRILKRTSPADGAGAGAGGMSSDGQGVPCKSISEQMITRDPDITRLLDRLENRGLITRQRDTEDRRVVSTRITEEGLRVLGELDVPVMAHHQKTLAHMPAEKMERLIELLELVRSGS